MNTVNTVAYCTMKLLECSICGRYKTVMLRKDTGSSIKVLCDGCKRNTEHKEKK